MNEQKSLGIYKFAVFGRIARGYSAPSACAAEENLYIIKTAFIH